MLILILSGFSEAYGQRSCKARSSRSKAGTNTSSSVFIQITDETNGRLVTYQKEFKLDHIPAGLRESYIEHLEDSLLYSGAGDFRFTNSKPGIQGKPSPQAIPQKSGVKKNARLARIR